MGLEAATFISELVATNPTGADDYSTADDHIRLVKAVLQGQFPNFGAVAVNATPAELDKLDGFTGLTADLNILSAAAAAGLTPTELLFLNGVTSPIQTQFAGKAPTAHSHTGAEISALDAGDTTTGIFAVGRIPNLAGKITSDTFANARIAAGNVTQHEAAIDHDALANFAAGEHRVINDAGSSAIELFSASKILTLNLARDVKVKTANTSRGTATKTDDPHLFGWILPSGETYSIMGYLRVGQEANDGGGIQFALQSSEAITGEISALLLPFGGTGLDHAHATTPTSSLSFASPTTIAYGVVFMGAISGHATNVATVDFQWAQASVDVDETILEAPSWVAFEKTS